MHACGVTNGRVFIERVLKIAHIKKTNLREHPTARIIQANVINFFLWSTAEVEVVNHRRRSVLQ